MVLHRQLAIGGFEFAFISVLGDAENIVKIALAHITAVWLTASERGRTVLSPSARNRLGLFLVTRIRVAVNFLEFGVDDRILVRAGVTGSGGLRVGLIGRFTHFHHRL